MRDEKPCFKYVVVQLRPQGFFMAEMFVDFFLDYETCLTRFDWRLIENFGICESLSMRACRVAAASFELMATLAAAC